MTLIQHSDLSANPDQNPSVASGGDGNWHRQGKLWSNLNEVCELLRIPTTSNFDDEEFLFQHVQFKAGQRIHTIGQPFDTLFIVHSGFLKTVLIDEFGNEQVLSFPMKGDMFGVDGSIPNAICPKLLLYRTAT